MNPAQAEELLKQWITLLRTAAETDIDCDMSPDKLTAELDRRQRTIDQIQGLDASVKSLQQSRIAEWSDTDKSRMDALIREGRRIAATIRAADAQRIEKAMKKRKEVLALLQKNTLSKGYLSSNRQLKIRPPAILDDKA